MLSTIADYAGIASFIISVLLLIFSHSLFKDMKERKTSYNEERTKIQTDLRALRENIWEDNLDSLQLRSKLRESLFSYRKRYLLIAFPGNLFHIQCSLHYLKRPINPDKKEKLCQHLDYLIGALDKKETVK